MHPSDDRTTTTSTEQPQQPTTEINGTQLELPAGNSAREHSDHRGASDLPVTLPGSGAATGLSLDDIRTALGRPDMTDEDAAALRDDLCAWLNGVLDTYFASRGAVSSRRSSS